MEKSSFNDEFVKKYSNLVYAAIQNRVKKCGMALSHEEVLDIRQDLFISILEGGKLDNVQNPESIPYWLAIASGNAAMQYLRKQHRREPVKPVSLFELIGGAEIIDLIPASGPGPSDSLGKDELSKKLDESIESLPIKEKLIIKLNLLHDKKYDEIADMLNLPKGTVSNYIKRAKEKLKRDLEEFR